MKNKKWNRVMLSKMIIVGLLALGIWVGSEERAEGTTACITNVVVSGKSGFTAWTSGATNSTLDLITDFHSCDDAHGGVVPTAGVRGPCTVAVATVICTVSWECDQSPGCGTGGHFDIVVPAGCAGVTFFLYSDGACSIKVCEVGRFQCDDS